MRRLAAVSALTVLVVSGCLVAIEDVADSADSSAGGSGGTDASAGGGSAGMSGTGANGGTGGQAGASGGGSAGASGGSAGGGGSAGAGGSAGSDGGGASGGTGGTATTCVLPFKDDFEDGTPATFWKAVTMGGATVAETGGKLSVSFPKTITTYAMAGYILEQPLNLTSCSVVVRVDETPPSTVNAAASFVLFYGQDGQDGNVEISKAASTLHFQYYLGPKHTYLAGQTYSPLEHLWWRFRHEAGNLNWETSADGKQWKTQAVAALSAQFSAVRIGGSAYLQENNVTGSVKLDDFGILP